MPAIAELLEISSARHKHLCPRQVLGVRMGMYAAELLEFDLPQQDKRLFTFMETDGCALDGVSVATGCHVGGRTMRVMDFGKIAATFVDTRTENAFRISPHPQVRQAAERFAPDEKSRWHAYMEAYQRMPLERLFVAQPVHLLVSMPAIISRAGAKAICAQCGEEIFNQREVQSGGMVLCKACAGETYYGLWSDTELSYNIAATRAER